MKHAYPVVMQALDDGRYAIRIPDFDQFTEGYDLADAIDMARDAIGSIGNYYEDEGKEIPKPNTAPLNLTDEEFLTFVDIDFDEFRAKTDNRLVRKNCTIPYYLEKAAERAGLNFSRVLSEALAEKLHLAID